MHGPNWTAALRGSLRSHLRVTVQRKEMAMIAIRQERVVDHDARELLLDRAYGPDRFTKCSQRLREDRLPAAGLSFVATDKGRIVGTVRLWNVSAGPGRP